jgi:hypothetical protein
VTDTYEGKPIAEMSKKELQMALLKALLELEQFRKKYNRMVRMLTGVRYDGRYEH